MDKKRVKFFSKFFPLKLFFSFFFSKQKKLSLFIGKLFSSTIVLFLSFCNYQVIASSKGQEIVCVRIYLLYYSCSADHDHYKKVSTVFLFTKWGLESIYGPPTVAAVGLLGKGPIPVKIADMFATSSPLAKPAAFFAMLLPPAVASVSSFAVT